MHRPLFRNIAFGIGLILIFAGFVPAQTTWHVNASNCPGPGDGSLGNPFCKIQDAVNASATGDTVLLAPGLYAGTGNKNINTAGKEITITSEAGWYYTTIDCRLGDVRAFTVNNGEGPGLVIEGLRIVNGTRRFNGPAGPQAGGAIYVANSSPTIRNCFFGDCIADGGGALYFSNSSSQVSDCRLYRNACTGDGGGAMVIENGSNITLERCHIFRNGSIDDDAPEGGIKITDSTLTMRTCLAAQNNEVDSNYGIRATNSTVNLQSCTVVDNGLNVVLESGSTLNATNSIVHPLSVLTGSVQSTNYCIVSTAVGAGDLTTYPTFVRPVSGNYELSAESSGIDAGDNSAGVDSIDLNNEPRQFDDVNVADGGSGGSPMMDIGAYERQKPSMLFNVAHCPDDFPTIQRAVDYAEVEAVVADGVYIGPGNTNILHGNRTITMRSESGDPALCIIDCEGQHNSGGFVCVGPPLVAPIIEGFTVRNANRADCDNRLDPTFGSYGGMRVTECRGGAVTAWGTSPIVRDCIFENCFAEFGGAIHAEDGDAIIENCKFLYNTGDLGGAFYAINPAHPLIFNCEFRNNHATGYGGAVCTRAFLDLTNCLFTGNTAPIYSTIDMGSRVVIATNCTMYANGGPLPIEGAALRLRNCIVAGHSTSPVISTTSANVQYSNIEGGYTGAGNINVPPLFVDAPNGDLRLAAGSAGIDAGQKNAVPAGVIYDLAGNPRFIDDPDTADTGVGSPPVDMGAYEFTGPVGPTCAADITGGGGTPDGNVNVSDLFLLLANWNTAGAGAELAPPTNIVNVSDLFVLLAAWGPCD